MTDDETRLAEIRARLAAATPGPWEPQDEPTVGPYDIWRPHWENPDREDLPNEEFELMGCLHEDDPGLGPFQQAGFLRWEDANFCAHAPADIAWLLEDMRGRP